MSVELWNRLCDIYNPSQIRAIWEVASCQTYDITLLQGPPGTGKTRTILGILSVLLAGAIPAAHDDDGTLKAESKSIKITVGATLQATRRLGESGVQSNHIDTTTSRILICAPSNTAVDEIVLRLRTEGVVGQDGKQWFPTVSTIQNITHMCCLNFVVSK